LNSRLIFAKYLIRFLDDSSKTNKDRFMINLFNKILPFFWVILMPMVALAQIESTDYYTPGEEKTELMIIVHVWGDMPI